MRKRSRVYLDFRIGDSVTSKRVVFELFNSEHPRLCENFRGLCTGEFGRGRDTNSRLHYLGSKIYRVIPGEAIQGGELSGGSESVYGGGIVMDPPTESDDSGKNQPGLLTMAKTSSTNTVKSQFIVTLGKSAILKTHAVFGRVVEGMDVFREIEKIPVDVTDKPRVDVVISGCGELKGDKHPPKEEQKSLAEETEVLVVPSLPSNVSPEMERRLLELRLKMNKAKQLNNQAALEEKKRVDDPKAYMRSATAGHKNQDETRSEKMSGFLHETVENAHKKDTKGDKDMDDPSAVAHERRVNEMGFFPDAYERQKSEVGSSAFYETSTFVSHKPSEDAKDRLVESLKRDQEKRNKFSRKRFHDDEAGDVEWINERNKQYTKKLDKAYGNYTAEIKSNIERGTAL